MSVLFLSNCEYGSAPIQMLTSDSYFDNDDVAKVALLGLKAELS